eukprot:TRINITY_DN12575_c0_g1_i1.p1 TRINITY_DN12575_c0_g1~~TRINITY_DN12575_c0_g1_i1.p1  ORF type:complete len:148 (+),score=70.66 TRINITY_DN12575_c0_g1_i1:60-503(+)
MALQLLGFFFFLMIRHPPRSTQSRSSAASDVYKRQLMFNNKVSFKSRIYQQFGLDVRNDSGVQKYRLGGAEEATTLGQLLLSKNLYYRGDPKVQGRLKFGMPPPKEVSLDGYKTLTVSYTHLRAHETVLDIVCRLLLEKKKNTNTII